MKTKGLLIISGGLVATALGFRFIQQSVAAGNRKAWLERLEKLPNFRSPFSKTEIEAMPVLRQGNSAYKLIIVSDFCCPSCQGFSEYLGIEIHQRFDTEVRYLSFPLRRFPYSRHMACYFKGAAAQGKALEAYLWLNQAGTSEKLPSAQKICSALQLDERKFNEDVFNDDSLGEAGQCAQLARSHHIETVPSIFLALPDGQMKTFETWEETFEAARALQ